MVAPVFLYHVVGDLTLGKPELVEFHETETVEAAIRAIGECNEGALTVWRKQPGDGPRAARFVGLLNSLDVVVFMAARVGDTDRALRTPVSEVVVPNSSLLKEVDPGTRLIDALEMMKQGVRRLLVRKSVAWKGMSKRFSILYHGKWLKNPDPSASALSGNSSSQPSPSSFRRKFCCLSREDVVRFLIGCLGALAPLPLSSITALGAITPHYTYIDASSPALEAVKKPPQDPCAIAVVVTNSDGTCKIIGEISAYKLWKCDYLAAAWAMANFSAGQFVMGFEDNIIRPVPDFSATSPVEDGGIGGTSRPRKFSSRSIGFFSNQTSPLAVRGLSMYRGRSAPLMCKNISSLAAVMAQMLSHRATHVWVTQADSDDILVGVVSYVDVLQAVTKNPVGPVPSFP
uniref:CBS domain-containing protein CBSX6 n=1 Tax=Anthurium amnicola TaxID=1678845 RepID=A0A1D1YWD8_9ARAE